MEVGSTIKIVMLIMGMTMVFVSVWLLAVKRMTADFVVIWEMIGIILIVIGIFPGLTAWMDASVMFGVTAGLWTCFFLSMFLSHLFMRNHELAIETSMLLQDGDREDSGKDLLIILPVKNEEKNIGVVLDQLVKSEIGASADILCINDASHDATEEIISQYPCTQITNIFELGYGSSLQLGYKYAVRKKYKYVIQMDADGQHDVCNIRYIYEKMHEKGADGREPDIVLASRFMEGSSEFPVSFCKKMAFSIFRFMIWMGTGQKIADPTTGLQGLSREAFMYYAQYANFDYQYPDANMVLQMLLLRFRLVEIPAVMHSRKEGKSMHAGIEPLWYMPRMFFSMMAILFRVRIMRQDRTR